MADISLGASMAMALGVRKNTRVILLFFPDKSVYYHYFCLLTCDLMLIVHSVGPSHESFPAPPLEVE